MTWGRVGPFGPARRIVADHGQLSDYNSAVMPVATLTQVLFIVYCLEVGFFLVFAPWSSSWDRVMLRLPLPEAALPWVLHVVFRGGVCGFGWVHVVWGSHDLQQLLSRRRARQAEDAARLDDAA